MNRKFWFSPTFFLSLLILEGTIGFMILQAPLLWSASTGDILLVDDFNEKNLLNKFNGKMGSWEYDPTDLSQWCKISYDETKFVGKSGSSLKIDYNIASDRVSYLDAKGRSSIQEIGFHHAVFNGIYSLLNNQNIDSYRYLVFSARGDEKNGFTRKFKLELKDRKRSASVIFDRLTSRWQKFSIPLDHFSSTIDLREVQEFVIVFDQNVTRSQGTIYIDDLYFSKIRAIAPKYNVKKVSDLVQIDGDLAEWNRTKTIKLNKGKHLESGIVRTNKDLSAKARFQWDESYLYFAVQVKDNEIVSLKTGPDILQGDVVQLFLDLQNDGFVEDNPDDILLGFVPSTSSQRAQLWSWPQNREPSTDEVYFRTRLTEGGYEIESAISWDFLNFQPAEKAAIGVSVSIHDVDTIDETQEAKLNYYFEKDEKNPDIRLLGSFQLKN